MADFSRPLISALPPETRASFEACKKDTRRQFERSTMLALSATIASAYLNVNGGPLERCSGPGMALTGFTRNGQCVDQQDDAGSHHVCLDLQTDHTGSFCDVTGQPNWCESSMPCDTGNSAADGWSKGAPGECAVQHWCVCQWAFASYLQGAGGCDQIKTIVCEATNVEAYLAYRKPENAGDPHIAEALRCLEQRCSLPAGDEAHVAEGAALLESSARQQQQQQQQKQSARHGGASSAWTPRLIGLGVLLSAAVPQHGQEAPHPDAHPLGGTARRLWAAQHSQGKRPGHLTSAPSPPRVCERAASKSRRRLRRLPPETPAAS